LFRRDRGGDGRREALELHGDDPERLASGANQAVHGDTMAPD
jgi:hypothetical protein